MPRLLRGLGMGETQARTAFAVVASRLVEPMSERALGELLPHTSFPDLLGDWREEVVLRTTDNKELRIFSTPLPTEHRLATLMHDPQYRLAIAWQNVAYNQPPHPSFFLGAGMKPAPRPNITLVQR